MHRSFFSRCSWIIAAILVPIATFAAQAPGGPPATPVEAVPVHTENLVIEINAVGTLLANETVTIRPENPGRIAAIHFNEGDRVSKGDVLVTLDDEEYRARLDESKASLKLQQRGVLQEKHRKPTQVAVL